MPENPEISTPCNSISVLEFAYFQISWSLSTKKQGWLALCPITYSLPFSIQHWPIDFGVSYPNLWSSYPNTVLILLGGFAKTNRPRLKAYSPIVQNLWEFGSSIVDELLVKLDKWLLYLLTRGVNQKLSKLTILGLDNQPIH